MTHLSWGFGFVQKGDDDELPLIDRLADGKNLCALPTRCNDK